MENDLFDHARQGPGCRCSRHRCSTGRPARPGVQIPRLFWKIAAWATHADPATSGVELAATGDVLDQTSRLEDLELASRRALETQDPPPLGPFRTLQVPVSDIAVLTGLDLGPLPAADRLPVPTAARSARWVRLQAYEDIRW